MKSELIEKAVTAVPTGLGAAALVAGLSATGAIFFSVGEAEASPPPPVRDNPGSPMGPMGPASTIAHPGPRMVERDLKVKWRDVRRTRAGFEFYSPDYAQALSQDRKAVVRALKQKYPGLHGDDIRVEGNRIFIANPGSGGPAYSPIENLCLHITLNLCKKS